MLERSNDSALHDLQKLLEERKSYLEKFSSGKANVSKENQEACNKLVEYIKQDTIVDEFFLAVEKYNRISEAAQACVKPLKALKAAQVAFQESIDKNMEGSARKNKEEEMDVCNDAFEEKWNLFNAALPMAPFTRLNSEQLEVCEDIEAATPKLNSADDYCRFLDLEKQLNQQLLFCLNKYVKLNANLKEKLIELQNLEENVTESCKQSLKVSAAMHHEAAQKHGEAAQKHGEAAQKHGEAAQKHGEAAQKHGEAAIKNMDELIKANHDLMNAIRKDAPEKMKAATAPLSQMAEKKQKPGSGIPVSSKKGKASAIESPSFWKKLLPGTGKKQKKPTVSSSLVRVK